MKIFPIAVLLFFLIFLAVTALFYLKLSSIENRLAGVPRGEHIDRRLKSVESAMEDLRQESFKADLRTNDRISALETGLGRPAMSGPESVEYLIASLKQDCLSLADSRSSDDPDRERNLSERIEATLNKLEARQDGGEDVVSALAEELQRSLDPEWKQFILTDALWQISAAAKETLMQFFAEERNPANLRVLAAEAVMKAGGGRPELKELAARLAAPGESLVVKTGLAQLFIEHPIPDAEPGLIEGVRGIVDPETGQLALYRSTHRIRCLQALANHDSPRTIRFLEEFLAGACVPAEGEQPDPSITAWALRAYFKVRRADAAPFLEVLRANPGVQEAARTLIESLLAELESPPPGGAAEE